MARTELTAAAVPKSHPGGSIVYSWTVADTTDQNAVALSAREVLLLKNTGASPQDVTISSTPDPYGREGDLVITVPAGEEHALTFLTRDGWMQTDGMLYLDCASVDISYAVLRLPSRPA